MFVRLGCKVLCDFLSLVVCWSRVITVPRARQLNRVNLIDFDSHNNTRFAGLRVAALVAFDVNNLTQCVLHFHEVF